MTSIKKNSASLFAFIFVLHTQRLCMDQTLSRYLLQDQTHAKKVPVKISYHVIATSTYNAHVPIKFYLVQFYTVRQKRLSIASGNL